MPDESCLSKSIKGSYIKALIVGGARGIRTAMLSAMAAGKAVAFRRPRPRLHVGSSIWTMSAPAANRSLISALTAYA
jgi:3-hydroxyisobutyrate dehydrogenase-like beta-hydroxyacid dehydrogenase